MSRDSVLIGLITIVGFAGAAAATLTRYGAPIEGAATDPELFKLIAEESPGRKGPPIALPAPVSALGIASLRDTARSRDSQPGDTSSRADPVSAWRAVAVEKDSIAVRQWLGRWVLATGETRGDTAQMTLWRVTLHSGCPLLSRLVVTTIGVASYEYRRVKVTSTCPEASSAGGASDPRTN
jgi:hypothetical protein